MLKTNNMKLFTSVLNFIESVCTFFLGERMVRRIKFFFKFNVVDFGKKPTLPYEKSKLFLRYQKHEAAIVVAPEMFTIIRLGHIDETILKSEEYPNSNILDFLELAQDAPKWRKLLEASDGKDICSLGDVFGDKSEAYNHRKYVRSLIKQDGKWRICFRDLETVVPYACVISFAQLES